MLRELKISDDLGGGTISYTSLERQLSYKQPLKITSVAPLTTTVEKTVKVVDEFDYPLTGAHVYFGQTSGSTTDKDGAASLATSNGAKVVTVSYIGFTSKKFTFNELPSVVELEMTNNALGEVIVTSTPKPTVKPDDSLPKYLIPAIGGLALLGIVMSASGNKPKAVTL